MRTSTMTIYEDINLIISGKTGTETVKNSDLLISAKGSTNTKFAITAATSITMFNRNIYPAPRNTFLI